MEINELSERRMAKLKLSPLNLMKRAIFIPAVILAQKKLILKIQSGKDCLKAFDSVTIEFDGRQSIFKIGEA